MLINFNKSTIYSIESITKSGDSDLTVEGSTNCNGSVDISGGENILTKYGFEGQYALSVKGDTVLANGSSNKDIYYSGDIDYSEWNVNSYTPIPYNDLPGFQDSRDLVGYLKYLMSLINGGTYQVVNDELRLKGLKTKSINVYEIPYTILTNEYVITIGPYETSNHVIKVNAVNAGTLTLDGLHMDGTGVKCPASNIIFAIDTPTLIIRNSTILGTIYAPNSAVTLYDCTIEGALYCKNVTFGTVSPDNGTIISPELFTGYIASPTPPAIKISPESTLDQYEEVNVEIYSDTAIPTYYEIRYTLDGSEPTRDSTLYTTSFDLYELGIVTIKAKLYGNGVPDGGVASQAYGFKCKNNIPSLARNIDTITGLPVYSIIHSAGSLVYYSLDGSNPSINEEFKYDATTFNDNFSEEGYYRIRYFEHTVGCDRSDFVEDDIIVELPIDDELLPPVVNIVSVDGTPIATIPQIGKLKKTIVIGQKKAGDPEYGDDIIELNINTPYTVQDVSNMEIRLNSPAGNEIRYTLDGTNPSNKTGYQIYNQLTPKQIVVKDMASSRLRAFSHKDFIQYSKQIDYTILFRTSQPVTNDTSFNIERSNAIVDSIQGGANYAIDISWIGPGVVTDDYAVYQSLINILATEMLERVFNPRFGVSITRQLAEISEIVNGAKIISDLKYEIEIQDPRILILEDTSLAYFDDELYALVIDLAWMNRLTNNVASLKYAYDTIL